jgi:RNA polymerase sigma-70 factor (ECF subfamily)
MPRPPAGPEPSGETGKLLQEARAGSAQALGQLLEGCKAYLHVVADRGLDQDLRPKFSPSDVVQESFKEAQNDFDQFHGQSRRELRNWLCGIVRNNLKDLRRRYRETARRRVGREQSLDGSGLEALRAQLAVNTPRPDEKVGKEQELESLWQAVQRLPADYQHVLRLHHQQGQSFSDIAQALGRSAGAVRKLWFRAVERLRDEMKGRHESG